MADKSAPDYEALYRQLREKVLICIGAMSSHGMTGGYGKVRFGLDEANFKKLGKLVNVEFTSE